MATRLPNASQQAAADAVVGRIDVGTTNPEGKLRIYGGAQPADADSAPGGTMLVELDLANPAYDATDTSGTASLAGSLSGSAVAAGTAASFRVVDCDEQPVFDGAVRATANPDNGEELVLDNTNIAVGQQVSISSLNYTQPASE